MRHNAWNYFASNIKDCPLDKLMNNNSFLQTMFCTSYRKEELAYLREIYEDETIEKMIEEEIINMPDNNNIHQLYHLTQFCQKTILTPDVITEFGAGYGAMCNVCSRLFEWSRYNIIDLPELQEVQQRYLGLYGLSDYVKWYNSIEDICDTESGMFIATWSLSETPQEIREIVMEKANFECYLLAYGKSFFDLENYNYFSEFAKKRNHLNWHKIKIPFMEEQYYLIGS